MMRRRIVVVLLSGMFVISGSPVFANHPGVDPNPCGVDGHRPNDQRTHREGANFFWVHEDGYVAYSRPELYVEVWVEPDGADTRPRIEWSGTGGGTQGRIGYDDHLVCLVVENEKITIP